MKTLLVASLLLCATLSQALASDPQNLTLETFVEKWNASLYKAEPVAPGSGMLPELLSCPPLPAPVLVYELPDRRPIVLDQHLATGQEWQAWWMEYGGSLALSLRKMGLRDEAVWRIFAPTPYLARPTYQPWMTSAFFRAEKNGRISEVGIEYRMNGNQIEYRSQYGDGWPSCGEWTYEVWPEFTQEKVRHFLATLINPYGDSWSFTVGRGAEVDPVKAYAR